MKAIKNKLALVEQEHEHLKAPFDKTNALLASKEETLALLRASYSAPTKLL